MKQIIKIKELELNEKGDIVKKPKHSIKHSKYNALEENEKVEIFRAIKDLKMNDQIKHKYEVLVHLMMDAGLRVSEALQVRFEWFVNTDDGIVIRIPDKARDLGNLKRDWKPKTLAGKREVIFVKDGIGEKAKSFFVNNPKGMEMKRQRAYQVINMLGKSMNKPKLHPHALRSTYANSLVYAGVTESTLCYYMGWNNLQTAVNYVKTSNIAARRDLMNKMRTNN